jgi:tRNA threonylcarbamoyladenosine biosynthesis protein TsaB
MRFLLVDTADSRGSVALVRDGRPEAVEAHPDDSNYSSWLLPAVQRLLAASGLSLAALDGYAVCSGPGSFTGLRVGLTTVKAWAEIYHRPIASVSRLSALAGAGSESAAVRVPLVAAYLDAQRGQVFAALYEVAGRVLEAEAVCALREFMTRVAGRAGSLPVLWRTPDPQLLEGVPEWQSRKTAGDALEPIAPPFASPLAAAAYRNFLAGQVTDALGLDANYVRRSDAEIFWTGNSPAMKA